MKLRQMSDRSCEIDKVKFVGNDHDFRFQAISRMKNCKEVIAFADRYFNIIEEPSKHMKEIIEESNLVNLISNKRYVYNNHYQDDLVFSSLAKTEPNKEMIEAQTNDKYFYLEKINKHNYKSMFENRPPDSFDFDKQKFVLGKCKNRSYNEDDTLILAKLVSKLDKGNKKLSPFKTQMTYKSYFNTQTSSTQNKENESQDRETRNIINNKSIFESEANQNLDSIRSTHKANYFKSSIKESKRIDRKSKLDMNLEDLHSNEVSVNSKSKQQQQNSTNHKNKKKSGTKHSRDQTKTESKIRMCVIPDSKLTDTERSEILDKLVCENKMLSWRSIARKQQIKLDDVKKIVKLPIIERTNGCSDVMIGALKKFNGVIEKLNIYEKNSSKLLQDQLDCYSNIKKKF